MEIPGLANFKKEAACNGGTPKTCLGLSAFALNGGIASLKEQIKNSVFVIDGIAIKGEFTVFAAPPNGGKTLLTIAGLIDSVKAGRIDGNKIFYINADDNQRGAISKTEIVEPLGIMMIVPVLADREKTGGARFDLVTIIKDMVADGNVNGEIIVLDTYKKFMSVMKKDEQSEFNNTLRDFVAMGGTVIVLAHANKRKVEGKFIIGGTSDLKDDCDCCWVIDPIDTVGGRIYNFEFNKGRGVDGEDKAFFVPTIEEEDFTERYRQMLNGVIPHEIGERVDTRKSDLQKKGYQAILLITEELKSGSQNRTQLEKAYKDSYVRHEVSRRIFQDVLSTFAGELWTVERRGQNKFYTLKTNA